MSIYLLFIQHIIFSLAAGGKAAIVVPTGFITAQAGIEKRIREKLVEEKMLRGVISMPSNIFATTGTNVSVLFIDKSNHYGNVVLMDASQLGTTIKEGKNQKTLLSEAEELMIIDTFNQHKDVDGFSKIVEYEDIKKKGYSLSAGEYFDIKIEYAEISADEFVNKINQFTDELNNLFLKSSSLELDIKNNLKKIRHG